MKQQGINAKELKILPGRCPAIAGTNWEKRSSHNFRNPRALRKLASTPSPACDASAWELRDAGMAGKTAVELFTEKVPL